MVARSAAYVASGLSMLALLSCILFVPFLYNKVNEINMELRLKKDEFQILSDEVWKDILIERSSSPVRKARQVSGKCECGTESSCPPGPPGPQGEPGLDGGNGERGARGLPGLQGVGPATTVYPAVEGCKQCPPGQPGPIGNNGVPGPPGKQGEPGSSGQPGNAGRPGYNGPPGQAGAPGASGKSGPPGPRGRDGQGGGKGAPGDKGPNGQRGPKGPLGQPGTPGRRGNLGSGGKQGEQGPSGRAGQPGFPGQPGPKGPPGEDAQYCPCPSRHIEPEPSTQRPKTDPTTPTTTTPTTTEATTEATTTTEATVQVKLEACASIIPERFVDYEIVPDSLPEPPPCIVEVVYSTPKGRKDIYLGNRAVEVQMANMPVKVLWPAAEDKLYTLVMYDLDSPSRKEPTNREVLLWMVINVPGHLAKRGIIPGVNAGDVIVDYVGPRPKPETGKHRVVYLVYKQIGPLAKSIFPRLTVDELTERLGFKVHNGFVVPNKELFEVLTPTAGNFVLSRFEEGNTGAGF